MAHNSNVQTVVETPTYLALARKLFSESEMSEIVAMVAADPKCGDLMRETGGFRKVRVRVGNRGQERWSACCVHLQGRKLSRLPHYCLREERESQPHQKGMQRA